MKESQVVTSLLKELKQHGFFWKASDKFVSGIPDIIGCIKGRFIGIEVKIDSNKPTPLQVYTLRGIAGQGGFSTVITYKNKNQTYCIENNEYRRKDAIQYILNLLNM